MDLPPTAVQVIEHQIVTRRCRCGVQTSGCAPDRVAAPVQYGPRLLGLIVYLYVVQFLSQQRTARAMADLFGVPVSQGTVAAATARAAGDLAQFTGLVRSQLAGSPVVHFDEAGLRVAARLAYPATIWSSESYESTTSYFTPSCFAFWLRDAKNLRAHSILAFSTPLSWRVDMEPFVSATK